MLEQKRINGDLTILNVAEAIKGDPQKNMIALEPEKIVHALREFA